MPAQRDGGKAATPLCGPVYAVAPFNLTDNADPIGSLSHAFGVQRVSYVAVPTNGAKAINGVTWFDAPNSATTSRKIRYSTIPHINPPI